MWPYGRGGGERQALNLRHPPPLPLRTAAGLLPHKSPFVVFGFSSFMSAKVGIARLCRCVITSFMVALLIAHGPFPVPARSPESGLAPLDSGPNPPPVVGPLRDPIVRAFS
jgi:hypothetical protein